MTSFSRRGFIAGCSSAVAAYAGTRFNTLAFGAGSTNDEILVTLFLRGGMDGLNLVPPIAGTDRGFYESARPNIAIPTTGSNSALPLSGPYGFHRATHVPGTGESPPATLYDLYQDGKLSVVIAAGMHEDNRSHFDSMSFMELGTPGSLSTADGWITRHLLSASNLPPDIVMPALSVGNLQATSLQGSLESVNMTDPDSFSLNVGPYHWRNAVRTAMRQMYGNGSSRLHQAGSEALDAIDIIELNSTGDYTPSNGAIYPSGTLGSHLQTIARMIRLDIGLRVATVDYGGWDTHNGQGEDGGGYFYTRVQELSRALSAFYTDLNDSTSTAPAKRLTVVIMSEFGRRLRENADRGTDHGHGNMMMVLSGNATGGVHGSWPGLSNAQLFDGADLEVTTDYRRVVSEILIRRMGNANLGAVFPDYQGYSPLGVVTGNDLPPIYGPNIFTDGFESGNLNRWSQSS